MRNPTDIKLCISLSHKYCLVRGPTYQLTQVEVCVILRCIILVSVCVMSGYCVISGCHVKLHHSCVSVYHVMLLCVCVSFQGVMSSCIIPVSVCVMSCYCMCHFRAFCVSCYCVYFMSRCDVSFITSGILPFEFRSSQFIWLHSFIVLFVCFIFVFYLPTPLFCFCFLFTHSSKR